MKGLILIRLISIMWRRRHIKTKGSTFCYEVPLYACRRGLFVGNNTCTYHLPQSAPCLCPEDSHVNPVAFYVKKINICTMDLLSNPNPRKLLTVAIQCRTSHFKNVFSVKKILILLFYTINCKQNVDLLTDFCSPELTAQVSFSDRLSYDFQFDTRHLLMKRIRFCSNERPNLLLKNHWVNINQTWHKTSLGEGDLWFYK